MKNHFVPHVAAAIVLLAACDTPATPRDILFVRADTVGEALRLWRMGADGADQRPFTTDTLLLGPWTNLPDWSPDGSKAAFTSGRGGDSLAIYVANGDGTRVTRLSPPQLPFASWPAWSPDGERILFNAGPTSEDQDLFVMDGDGSDLTQLTSGEWMESCARWSPDGARILVAENLADTTRLMIIDLSDGSRSPILPRGFDANCGDWSPDGTSIAFSSPADHDWPSYDAPDDAWPTVHSIYVLDLASGTVRQVTQLEGLSDRPRWSRDGRWIAFNSTESVGSLQWPDPRIIPGTEIYVIGADGSDLRRLTTNTTSDGHPVW